MDPGPGAQLPNNISFPAQTTSDPAPAATNSLPSLEEEQPTEPHYTVVVDDPQGNIEAASSQLPVDIEAFLKEREMQKTKLDLLSDSASSSEEEAMDT